MATPPRTTPSPAPSPAPAAAPEEAAAPIADDRKRFLLQNLPTFAEVGEVGDIKALVKDGLLKLAGKKAELTEKGKQALAALTGGQSTP